MQQKTYQPPPIGDSRRNPPTPKDLELLEKHGMEGLKSLGLYGVIDRLSNPE